jgi:SHS2 domain-containing protein
MIKKLNYFDYFNHEADMGIIGYGESLEAAFEQAARAVFNLMTDIEKTRPREEITVSFEENDPEFAFITLINQLLPEAAANDLALCQFRIKRRNSQWDIQAWGEPWSDDLVRGTEVKGATFTELKVAQADNGTWYARCVVDV